MDSVSMDHYEKQLYSVFKTYDLDNDEALDRAAVLDLCNALQLDDRSSSLVDTLFEKPEERVTFTQFRNGLLTVLGGGEAPSISVNSDDDSSGREVAPKFVYGSKKYGRRSRPQTMGSPSSRDDVEAIVTSSNSCQQFSPKTAQEIGNRMYKKSSLAINSDTSADSLDHDRYIDYDEAVVICNNLHMGGIDRQIIEQIFSDCVPLAANKITVGEFFHRLNNSLTTSIATVGDDDTVLSHEVTVDQIDTCCDVVDSAAVLEAWESAGVESGPRLLQELGFITTQIRVGHLSRALDQELRALACQPRPPAAPLALLLQASLALHRFQFLKLKSDMDQVFEENNKLKSDLSDANRRAQVLAQEVDENHARMEGSLKNKIKQMEIKHADNVRSLTSEWVTEKERISTRIIQLEDITTRLTAEETRLKAENLHLKQDNDETKKKLITADDKISELESVKLHLNKELKALSSEKNEVSEEVEQQNIFKDLTRCIEDLQLENKMLRDRNDELCAEVDSLTNNQSRDDQRHLENSVLDIVSEKAACWQEEANNLDPGERPGKRRGDSPSLGLVRTDDESPRVGKLRKRLSKVADGADISRSTSLHISHLSQECDSPLISLDQRFMGHLEIMRRLNDILEFSQKNNLPKTSQCESCNNLKDIIAMIQEHISDLCGCIICNDQSMKFELSTVSVQTEDGGDDNDDEVRKLKDRLTKSEENRKEDKTYLSSIIKELETNLAEVKSQYETCEQYYEMKLEEERDFFADEQKASDERLQELISKITEYEQQFVPKTNNSTLPTIDEKYNLEVQFTDLETEFEEYKIITEKELKIKTEEIEQLKDKIKVLEVRSNEQSPMNWDKRDTSPASSPIGYLWSQGTIQSPFAKDKRPIRDYQNPAFARSNQTNKFGEESGRCSSDGEKEKLKAIQRPSQRSSSVGALRDEADKLPTMIHCSELEGHLRRQTTQPSVSPSHCDGCVVLEMRCRQLRAAIRQHQFFLASVQQAARNEGTTLRARITAAETAVSRLQQRLTAADVLVKDLYLENCQLAHQNHSRLL